MLCYYHPGRWHRSTESCGGLQPSASEGSPGRLADSPLLTKQQEKRRLQHRSGGQGSTSREASLDFHELRMQGFS